MKINIKNFPSSTEDIVKIYDESEKGKFFVQFFLSFSSSHSDTFNIRSLIKNFLRLFGSSLVSDSGQELMSHEKLGHFLLLFAYDMC